MSFFDLDRLDRFSSKYDEIERSKRELKQAKEDLAHLKWQQRSADYEKERQHYREQQRKEQELENRLEWHSNNMQEKERLRETIEDLKLRRKFGIEEGE